MLPQEAEYAVVLVVLVGACLALFWTAIRQLIVSRTYWSSLGAFFIFCFAVEFAGVHWQWWVFSNERLLGLSLGWVPIEEVFLFLFTHTLVVAMWEMTGR